MNGKTINERMMYSKILLNKYPKRIPVIIEKAKEFDIELLDKVKYLIPKELYIREFLCIIRKRIKIDSRKAIFIFINNNLVPMSTTIGELYNSYKNEDGFLYVKYTIENTFG
jgi:GABA(A) receptor-associated protein